MKKSLHDKIKLRKIKRPNKFVARVVYFFLGRTAKKRGCEYHYDFDLKDYKNKQFILICNHGSRDDWMYTLCGMKNTNLHIVIGYRNVFQKFVYGVLLKLGVIAKYLYQPDHTALKQMLSVIKNGGNLFLAPEGIQSTSGSTHPINPATLDFFIKCKLPVILCKTHGTYMTRSRYSTDVKIGKISLNYSCLFTPEELTTKTKKELYEKFISEFSYNEFDYNRKHKIAFKGKLPNAYGLEHVLYKCPVCNSEHVIHVDGDLVCCTTCGYKVKMDEYYLFNPVQGQMIFDDLDKWYKWQRKIVREQILQDDFILQEKVLLSDINPKRLGKNFSQRFIGEGVLTLTKEGLLYKGTRLGQEYEQFFEASAVYSLTFDLDGGLALYYKNNFFHFTLSENPLHNTKWMISAEEIHNLYDDAWKQASAYAYDY